jgi:glycosyltransferase involved in cell wall biosynthesis
MSSVVSKVSQLSDETFKQAPSRSYAGVAVLIPCLNEQVTVGKVVRDVRAALPGADVYVFDNGSTDETASRAAAAGAIVVPSPLRGKGNVVRHMFREVDASIYLMLDGDDTYPAAAAPQLIELMRAEGVDMVVGARLQEHRESSFRKFHVFGNRLVAKLISTLFGANVADVMSGYRVFSRDFVKTVPVLARGFEVETELTLQALAKGYTIREASIAYGERPEGSFSKLSTYSDGALVLRAIFLICKDYKPLAFFSAVAAFFALTSVAVGWLPVKDYLTTGFVPHFPSAILAAALGVLSALSIAVGLILQTLLNYHLENFELWRRAQAGQAEHANRR